MMKDFITALLLFYCLAISNADNNRSTTVSVLLFNASTEKCRTDSIYHAVQNAFNLSAAMNRMNSVQIKTAMIYEGLVRKKNYYNNGFY